VYMRKGPSSAISLSLSLSLLAGCISSGQGPASLLPHLGHLHEVGQLLGLAIIGREDVIDVLLVAIVVQLAAALRAARHLGVDLLDVFVGAVGALE